MKTTFIRVIEAEDKANALLNALRDAAAATEKRQRFDVDSSGFANVPGSPFTYWVSDRLRSLFTELPRFGTGGRSARQGLATSDDFRFLRAWWGLPADHSEWHPCAKGGAFSPFYVQFDLMIRWEKDAGDEAARELKAFAESTAGTTHWSRNIRSPEYYFRPGLTWPLRTHRFCPQVMPAGVVITIRGSGIYSDDPLLFLALFSSQLVDRLMRMLSGKDAHPQFDMGDVASLPIPHVASADRDALASLARRGWSLRRSLDTHVETSRAYTLPALLQGSDGTIEERVAAWSTKVRDVVSELARIQTEIDMRSFDVYRIDNADRRAIADGFGASVSEDVSTTEEDGADETPNVSDDAGAAANTATLVDGFVSWAVGVAFGRFDLRLATNERPIPPEPEPFDPLPSRSPGMYPAGEEPADRPDILVDDEGHPDDLAARALTVAERVRVGVPENLRAWLAREFLPLHIKTYSKSRRKAPIYWQLATPSAGYSVWLYIHAFTKDTLFRIQNDYAAPKLAHEERRLESLTRELADKATAAQRKELSAQESFVDELRAFLEEVKRVAPLWSPNLDDGVVINFAPLWRLVPHHKPWQKDLKSTWDAICDGKYDWAHLAMHLWPERVVLKCAKDRSLAIAHGLEDVFWVEGTDGKWNARKTPKRSVDELVRERTSPAVRAALKSLLEAPVAQGGGARGRGGRGRAAASADEGGSR